MVQYTYKISGYGQNSQNKIAITEDDYREIIESRKIIRFGLEVEEKFDIIMENYYELEQLLIDSSMKHHLFPKSIDEMLSDVTHNTNRRLANLLTTIRLYRDQLEHSLSKTFGRNNSIAIESKNIISKQSSANKVYVVVDAIRNHIQHAALPIESVSFSINKAKPSISGSPVTPKYIVSNNTYAYIRIKNLRDNKRFNKEALKIIERLANGKEDISLIPLIREYMDIINRIHKSLRILYDPIVNSSIDNIQGYRKSYFKKYPNLEGKDDRVQLVATKLNPNGSYDSRESLTDKAINRIAMFRAKNRCNKNIHHNFITSEQIFFHHPCDS